VIFVTSGEFLSEKTHLFRTNTCTRRFE
jgi:hypothetical protein